MKNILYVISLIFFINTLVYGQEKILDNYVNKALEANQGIKQQQFLLQKNLWALEEAKGFFLPSVNFVTTYTLAKGGRRINLPVGDLVNPVYRTLNLLTASNNFPQIENAEEQFLPNDFYDTRIKIQQPIINYEIHYNKKIKQTQIEFQRNEIEIYKRELVKDVKLAYFRYLQSLEAVKIYQNGNLLLDESQRINESLIKNGMVNNTVLLKIEAERQKLKAKIIEAQNNQKNALAYCNFLLNQNFDNVIEIDSTYFNRFLILPEVNGSVEKREELNKLTIAKDIQQNILALNKSAFLPKLGAGLDVGSQAFHWQFNNKSAYYLLGFNLEVPIFNGFRNKNKIKQTKADIDALDAQTEQVKSQLKLVNQIAKNNYENVWNIYLTYPPQLDAYQKNYQDLLKKYKQGQSTIIELLQAQNDITNTKILQSLSFFDIWLKKVELERTIK